MCCAYGIRAIPDELRGSHAAESEVLHAKCFAFICVRTDSYTFITLLLHLSLHFLYTFYYTFWYTFNTIFTTPVLCLLVHILLHF